MSDAATASAKDRSRDFKTGTGGAFAPLSEILPSARDARFVQDDRVNSSA
jgi:hypothetical protein